MEKIYPPSKFVCSENMPLKDYFRTNSETCNLKVDPDFSHYTEKQKHETICNMMNIKSKAERKRLEEECSIDMLTGEGECIPEEGAPSSSRTLPKVADFSKIPEEAKGLETVKTRLQYANKLQSIYEKTKYRQEPYVCEMPSGKSEANDIEPGAEFAVAIRIYHPFEFNYANRNSYQNLKFSHEIVCLGSNTLADLRDKILCPSDVGLCVEVEDPKAEICIGDAKEKYPSGFIFIDDTFYNDTRHENSIDYSEVIRKWAQEKSIGPFEVGTLQTTRIDELAPRFGYAYVYQHQAKCEHLLVFTDAWLLSCKDSLNSKDYPAYSSIHRFYSKHCTICYSSNARWICVDCDRLPHAKTFLCQECFISYNYKDGKKIGNFKAYPFFDRSSVV